MLCRQRCIVVCGIRRDLGQRPCDSKQIHLWEIINFDKITALKIVVMSASRADMLWLCFNLVRLEPVDHHVPLH